MTMGLNDIVQLSPGGSFELALSLGLVRGMSFTAFSGLRTDIPEGITDLNPFATELPFPNNSGEAMEVVSANANDTSTLNVEGLDENGLSKTEEVVINGQTPVPLSGLWSRINYASNIGDSLFAGVVSVRGAGGGTIYCQTTVNQQVSFNGAYTPPINKRVMVYNIIQSIYKDGGSDIGAAIEVSVRLPNRIFVSPFVSGLQRSGSNITQLINSIPEALPPFTDIKLSSIIAAGGGGTLSALTRVYCILLDTGIFPQELGDG